MIKRKYGITGRDFLDRWQAGNGTVILNVARGVKLEIVNWNKSTHGYVQSFCMLRDEMSSIAREFLT